MDITGIGTLAEAAEGIVNHFFPDKTQEEKDQAANELQGLMNQFNLVKGQEDINLEEAKSPNWFVAGWRPFVGWICGFSLLYAAIIEPLGRFTAKVLFNYAGQFPVLDTTITLQTLFGILGIGAMRTFEKHQGVEGNR